MSSLGSYFTSSIGKKFVMGFTGIFLITFLVVHCYVNAMIFYNDGGIEFNKAAHFMGSNPLIRTAEIGLFAGLLAHIIQGLMLWRKNMQSRPVKYAINAGNATSKWYSRSMGLLGTLILIFLVVHLAQFWVPSRITGLGETIIENKPYHDLYSEMQEEFQHPWVVLIYVIGVLSLAYHLLHGVQSSMQTFGLNTGKYKSIIKTIGIAFSIIVPLVFALMPILMHLGIIR